MIKFSQGNATKQNLGSSQSLAPRLYGKQAKLCLSLQGRIEHPENNIIAQSGLFQNEIGPGVFQFNAQWTWTLQKCQKHKAQTTDYISILSL